MKTRRCLVITLLLILIGSVSTADILSAFDSSTSPVVLVQQAKSFYCQAISDFYQPGAKEIDFSKTFAAVDKVLKSASSQWWHKAEVLLIKAQALYDDDLFYHQGARQAAQEALDLLSNRNLEKYQELEPIWAMAQYLVALTYYEEGEWLAALKSTEKINQRFQKQRYLKVDLPHDLYVVGASEICRGICLKQLGRKAEAVKVWQQVVEDFQGKSRDIELLAQIWLDRTNKEDKHQSDTSTSPVVQLQQAKNLFRQEVSKLEPDFDEVFVKVDQVLKSPLSIWQLKAEALGLEADCWYSLKNGKYNNKAIKTAQKALDLFKNKSPEECEKVEGVRAHALYTQGLSFFKKVKLKTALEKFEEIDKRYQGEQIYLQYDEFYIVGLARLWQMWCLKILGHQKEAREVCQRTIEDFRGNSLADSARTFLQE